MAPRNDNRKAMNKGAWTAEEDRKLSEYIETHGSKRWKTIAVKSGLSRCGKSCRLRWLNYLRPNIKRGNISDDEEDLILRLHKLLGNRWSLIAGRLPGRTDNEIKNYWNSHLSKKINQMAKKTQQSSSPTAESESLPPHNLSKPAETDEDQITRSMANNTDLNFDVNEFLDFSTDGDWINNFLEQDEDAWMLNADER